MKPNNDPQDGENAGEIKAKDQSTIPDEPEVPEKVWTGPLDSSSSSNKSKDEELGIQHGLQSTEKSGAVQPGPPVLYSTFSIWQKRYIITIATIATFISPTSALIYFPALNPIQAELGISNTLANLTVTSYVSLTTAEAYSLKTTVCEEITLKPSLDLIVTNVVRI
jgi:hypothetical protein